MTKTKPKSPPYWEAPYRKLYQAITAEYEFSASEIETLKVGIDCLRRRQQAREIIDREGLTLMSASGTAHKHPAIEIEKIATAGWIAAFRALALKTEEIEFRPGRPGGRKTVQYA